MICLYESHVFIYFRNVHWETNRKVWDSPSLVIFILPPNKPKNLSYVSWLFHLLDLIQSLVQYHKIWRHLFYYLYSDNLWKVYKAQIMHSKHHYYSEVNTNFLLLVSHHFEISCLKKIICFFSKLLTQWICSWKLFFFPIYIWYVFAYSREKKILKYTFFLLLFFE